MTRFTVTHVAVRVLLCVAGMLITSAGVANAAASPGAAAPATSAVKPLDACIQAAELRKLDRWACLGGVLSWVTEVQDGAGPGTSTTSVERVAPEAPDVPAAVTADDYDYWCENGTVCTRKISNYISETKGNGAYGNSGVFRAIGNGNYIGPGRTRVNSGIIYGNRLNDANPYYATLGGYFTPDGYPRYTFGTLTSARWNCPSGTGNCTFP